MIDLVVAKKQLSRAVDRNLVRRRIRAVLQEINPGWRKLEGKIFARPEMMTMPLPELKRQIELILKKAKLI